MNEYSLAKVQLIKFRVLKSKKLRKKFPFLRKLNQFLNFRK